MIIHSINVFPPINCNSISYYISIYSRDPINGYHTISRRSITDYT